MRLANLIRIGVCPILGAWLGCNAIIGLELGEPEATGSGAGSGGEVASSGSGDAACGNGARDGNEECDDGNDDASDGCDALCQVECALPGGLEGAVFEGPVTHHCYVFVHDTAPPLDQERPWYDALYLCRAHGFDLAAITSAEEYGLLSAVLEPNVWIGGNDRAEEGVFAWTNGEPWGFTFWASGEPGGGLATNCVESRLVGLNDQPCQDAKGYVCERHPPGRCGDGVIDAAEECDDGNDVPDDGCAGCQVECEELDVNGVALEDPRSHHCYIHVDASATWTQASGACGYVYGFYPAALSSAEELAFILSTRDVVADWVGATDEAMEGEWAWSNGESWEFDPWTGDPGNTDANDCLRFQFGDLVAADCTEQHTYLCERDPVGRRSPDAPLQ